MAGHLCPTYLGRKIRTRGCPKTLQDALFVILNPSPCVNLSEVKGLGFRLRVNSVKNLKNLACYKFEILRFTPQNDILGKLHNGFLFQMI